MISKKTILIIMFITISSTLTKGQVDNCLKQFSRYDTISANHNFLQYHITDNSAFIEYGSYSFHQALPDKYDCQIPDSWIPKFEWDSRDFIVLKYACGSPCWGILVLPLDSVNPKRNIMYEMAFDSINNLVVYLGGDNYDCLIIENLKTHQARRIDFPFKTDHGEFIGYWIDSISIKDNKLYYKYSDPNDNNNKKTHTEVKVDINI
jgi:hypothetical protein